jgi:hypothetical protein
MHAEARRPRHLRRRIGGVYKVHNLWRELEQTEGLHLVRHAKGHAALVLLCRHGPVCEGDAATERRRVFVCGVADLQPGLLDAIGTR